MVLLPVTVLVLRSRGILAECVVAHPITLFPFSQVFFVTGEVDYIYGKIGTIIV